MRTGEHRFREGDPLQPWYGEGTPWYGGGAPSGTERGPLPVGYFETTHAARVLRCSTRPGHGARRQVPRGVPRRSRREPDPACDLRREQGRDLPEVVGGRHEGARPGGGTGARAQPLHPHLPKGLKGRCLLPEKVCRHRRALVLPRLARQPSRLALLAGLPISLARPLPAHSTTRRSRRWSTQRLM